MDVAQQLLNVPTNLMMGFLGVGKTTAILDLLKQKPENENWAVLVNEFGKIGIDGAIYSAAGVAVKEIAGGCLCCTVGLPFQVSVNRLLKEVRPDRLLIEPTGLGHPKKVLDMLMTGVFKETLELRASICLVDPEKLKDNRYTTHETFIKYSVKPLPSGGGYKRSHTTVSDWRTLLFNVLSDYIYWCTTTTPSEITRRP